MRRTTMILMMGAFLLALFVPGALAAESLATSGCASVFSGTDGPDTLKGDHCDNNISGLRGDDVIYGYRGADELYGNQDNDRLYGGKGRDDLHGGRGNDRIYSGSLDGVRDRIVCGDGRDFASIAENDYAASDCETVVVSIE
jgi:Ca2+-binding RTX toxin-like protein